MNLRSRTIRLAHEKPELRPHLLPLLREAATKLKGLSSKSMGELEEFLDHQKTTNKTEYPASGFQGKKTKAGEKTKIVLPKVLEDWAWMDRRSDNSPVHEAINEWLAAQMGVGSSELYDKFDVESEDLGEPFFLTPKT